MSLFGAHFRFHDELNDFLDKYRKNQSIFYTFGGKPSVKDCIEALGVPHTEVDCIIASKAGVDFSYHVTNRDSIDVYPAGSIDTNSTCVHLRPDINRWEFILDVHLGKLARFLRMCGFDTIYENDFDDHRLARLAAQSGRILLTRDRRLLMFKDIVYGYWLRAVDPDRQLKEVLTRFSLFERIENFKRCIRCNGIIEPVDKQSVIDELEPLTKKHYDQFYQCVSCRQIYWKGSHYDKMSEYLQSIVST